MFLSSRPFQRQTDLPAILAVVKARPAERILDYPGLLDLQELLSLANIQQTTRVWQTSAGRFAGFAMINAGETFANLAFEAARGIPLDEIYDDMINWGKETCLKLERIYIDELASSVHEGQAERIAALEKSGFTRAAESTVFLERNLNEPITEPRIPPGFSIRPVAGEAENPAWVAMHRAAHGTQNMTLGYRTAMTHTPDYDPQLDLVAVAPDGTLAAYVFGAFNREEISLCGRKIGYTDPVATHPAFQRRGLAQALLLESLRRFKERGLQWARLGTHSTNLAMQKAAQAAGFRIVDVSWQYVRALK